MDETEPPLSRERATREVGAETKGLLPVFWDHRQLAVSAPIWENSDGTMEEMVREKIPARIPYLGEVPNHAQEISSTGNESGPLGIRQVAKL
jgi:hypothetical protein